MNINTILKLRNIAIIGASREPGKASYNVAEYLKAKGYRIIPINPYAEEILGERCYKNLLSMPEEVQKAIEVVDIFMKPENVLQPVKEAIEIKALFGNLKVIWMQLGIINEEAARKARDAGLTVIMDKCMMKEHKKILA